MAEAAYAAGPALLAILGGGGALFPKKSCTMIFCDVKSKRQEYS